MKIVIFRPIFQQLFIFGVTFGSAHLPQLFSANRKPPQMLKYNSSPPGTWLGYACDKIRMGSKWVGEVHKNFVFERKVVAQIFKTQKLSD